MKRLLTSRSMTRRRTTRAFISVLIVAVGCRAEQPAPKAPATTTAPPATAQTPGPSTPPMKSPDSYAVRVETSKGGFTIGVTRSLAPLGADRFYELVKIGYFTDVRFFRVMPGFVAQFGLHGDPAVNALWTDAVLPDEPMRVGNTRGTVAFTTSGPKTRSNQLFVNTADNRAKLDGQKRFAPIGTVTDGMDVLDKLNSEYGEEPNQSRIGYKGNEYLMKWFPALDYIKSATLVTNR